MIRQKTEPAILFYPSSFLGTVDSLSMRERGQFITLLCRQHMLGHQSMRAMVRATGKLSEDLMELFATDDEGLFYNPELEEIKKNRQSFCEKQREKALQRYDKSRTECEAFPEAPLPSPSDSSSGENPASLSSPDPSVSAPSGSADGTAAALPNNKNKNTNTDRDKNKIKNTYDRLRYEEKESDTVQGVRGSGREGAALGKPLPPLPGPPSAQSDSALNDARRKAFERFWDAYPRKVGRKKAEDFFSSVPEALWDRLPEIVAGQTRSDQWQRDGGRFIPNPATWLSEGRWEDQPERKPSGPEAEPFDWDALQHAIDRI